MLLLLLRMPPMVAKKDAAAAPAAAAAASKPDAPRAPADSPAASAASGASKDPRQPQNEVGISLTKNPTICSCEYRIVGTAFGNFGGAPYGATNRVRGVPTCVESMRRRRRGRIIV